VQVGTLKVSCAQGRAPLRWLLRLCQLGQQCHLPGGSSGSLDRWAPLLPHLGQVSAPVHTASLHWFLSACGHLGPGGALLPAGKSTLLPRCWQGMSIKHLPIPIDILQVVEHYVGLGSWGQVML